MLARDIEREFRNHYEFEGRILDPESQRRGWLVGGRVTKEGFSKGTRRCENLLPRKKTFTVVNRLSRRCRSLAGIERACSERHTRNWMSVWI